MVTANKPLIYDQMPHESNIYHGGIDVLERMAKNKSATFTITINKNGRWTIKSGLLKSVAHNFVNAVSDFAMLIYPDWDK